jgi:hypothetical protein
MADGFVKSRPSEYVPELEASLGNGRPATEKAPDFRKESRPNPNPWAPAARQDYRGNQSAREPREELTPK